MWNPGSITNSSESLRLSELTSQMNLAGIFSELRRHLGVDWCTIIPTIASLQLLLPGGEYNL